MVRTILLVEDEIAIREMIRFALEQSDFICEEAESAQDALQVLANMRPDLILLDWMLPETSGIELARRLRREEAYRDIPIIMLTARGEEDDKIRGLEAGADDYITKPFSPRELIARVKAVMRRRSPGGEDEKLEVDGLVLDTLAHQVLANGEPVELGPTEFRLLRFFMQNHGRVYSRSQLLDRVWGTNVYVEERTVDVHIRRLRKALTACGHHRHIQTVRGAGYRFSRQV